MKMEINIEDKVVYWIINKKIKRFDFFYFSECIEDLGLDSNNNSHIIKIDKGFEIYNSRIKNLFISINEENN
jgi:hypothetical protein